MRNKESTLRKLRQGYCPQELGAKPKIASIYKSVFKRLVDYRNLHDFFEIYNTGEPILKAWGFLGIYQILEGKESLNEKDSQELHKIIIDLLNEEREVTYYSGSVKTEVSLRDHHSIRVISLESSLVYEPVLEYCVSAKSDPDEVKGELLEEMVSKRDNPQVESLLLKYADNVRGEDYRVKLHLVHAFENLGQLQELKETEAIQAIFKAFLKQVQRSLRDPKETQLKIEELTRRKKTLEPELIRIAAVLHLGLEEETLTFLESLEAPFHELDQVAEEYKNSKKFQSLLLQKLTTLEKNPLLMCDVLRALIVLQNEIPQCSDLIIEKVNEHKLNDAGLIIELEKADIIDESLIRNYLEQGHEWQLNFIREYLNVHPEKLNQWSAFQSDAKKILHTFEAPISDDLKEKKRLVLRLIIDLEKLDLLEECLELFKNEEDDDLKKIALFALLKYGNDEIWMKLRKVMEKDSATGKYVKKFWDRLERREWQFHY